MLRRVLIAAFAMLCGAASAVAQVNIGLVPESSAERHGLTRPWWGQAQVDKSVSRLQNISLHYGTLLAVTDRGNVQAFDAENGRMLWSQQVGNRKYPTMNPAANSVICAVLNGSTLYMYELASGRFYDKRDVTGVPSGPPAVSRDTVYVPTQRGLVEAHKILSDGRPPQTYAALGSALFSPYVTKESVVWPTERGNLYAVSTEGGQRFNMTAFKGIAAGVTYAPPYVYCGSIGGYVYAVHETNGRVLWRFSAGDAVREMPIVVKDVVYVSPVSGGLFRLKTALGQEEWFAPGIKRVLAVSEKRVYALDLTGRVLVLDAATGGRIDTLPITGNVLAMSNYQNDRIYLANDTGLIQCLHESGLTKPVNHLWEPRERVELTEGQKLDQFMKPPAKDDKPGKKPPADPGKAAEKPPEEGAMPAPGPMGKDPFAPDPATPPPPAPGPVVDPFK